MFHRSEMLYLVGDPVQQIILLTSGAVKITQIGASGFEVIIRLAVAGDVLGALGLFSTGRHCTNAEVFRPCEALVWDSRDFSGLLKRYSILHQNLVQIISGYLSALEERFREVATEKVGPRLARQLLRLRDPIGRTLSGGGLDIGLSREELAQMTGTTLFTVSRTLSAWERRGLVKLRREGLTIFDQASLLAASEQTHEANFQAGERPVAAPFESSSAHDR
jgi:CRP-like cAMP-binding protein